MLSQNDVDELKQRLDELPQAQRSALERRLLLLATTESKEKLVPRKSAAAPIPLSFGQLRLWFLEQIETELTAFNMAFAWRLRGTLNTDVLRRALETIVQRHEPLRRHDDMSARVRTCRRSWHASAAILISQTRRTWSGWA